MPDVLTLIIDRMDTPIGELLLVTDNAARLRAVDWADHEFRMRRLLGVHYGRDRFELEPAHSPHSVRNRLERYFAGHVDVLSDIPVETAGTPFQRTVWNELRRIPCGAAISYRQLAERIGRAKATRAVGLANGANPIGIVVPCHRVIGSDGSLTGYGGGVERKRWLLEHERQYAVPRDSRN
jgi:methylated-DNA-[protein]-cysteine S-methyltransferase